MSQRYFDLLFIVSGCASALALVFAFVIGAVLLGEWIDRTKK